MDARPVLVLACLLALGLTAAGAGAVTGGDPSSTSVNHDRPLAAQEDAPNVTTREPYQFNATAVSFVGEVADASGNLTARFEYRERAPDVGWTRTPPTKIRGSGGFHWNVTGLQPGTTYEVRAVVTRGNLTRRGPVKTFTTRGGTGNSTPTGTPTLPPCSQYSGAGSSLCTSTPTPTDPPTSGDTGTPDRVDDGVTSPTRRPAGGPDGWLDGLVPLLGWVAVVAVVAPLVLGGLLGLDSLRGPR